MNQSRRAGRQYLEKNERLFRRTVFSAAVFRAAAANQAAAARDGDREKLGRAFESAFHPSPL